MTSWYIYSLGAFLCYGLLSFFYKVAAKRKYQTTKIMFAFMTTVTLLGTGMLIFTGEKTDNFSHMIILSFLNAFFFLVVTVTTIEALKYFPTNTFFPVIRTNVVLVVLFSLLYFKDTISITQGVALALSIPVILLVWSRGGMNQIPKQMRRKGNLLMVVALLGTALVTVVVKLGAELDSPFWFITLSYGMNIFFSLGMVRTPFFRVKKEGGKSTQHRKERKRACKEKKQNYFLDPSMIMGFEIGLLNFLGFVALLNAYSTGPTSLIATLVSLSFIITILLSGVIYKEIFTPRRIVVVGLAVVACILMGI